MVSAVAGLRKLVTLLSCMPCSHRHIASGVTMKQKRLTPDEMTSIVDRLCTVKSAGGELGRPHVSAPAACEGERSACCWSLWYWAACLVPEA